MDFVDRRGKGQDPNWIIRGDQFRVEIDIGHNRREVALTCPGWHMDERRLANEPSFFHPCRSASSVINNPYRANPWFNTQM
jgi:hypothetical protein